MAAAPSLSVNIGLLATFKKNRRGVHENGSRTRRLRPNNISGASKVCGRSLPFNQLAYYNGIESFPAKRTNRYAVDCATLFGNDSESCPHFTDDRADWFQSKTASSQLKQLRRQCPCRTKAVPSQPTKRARCFEACKDRLLYTLSDFIASFPSSRTTNEIELLDTAKTLESQLRSAFKGV